MTHLKRPRAHQIKQKPKLEQDVGAFYFHSKELNSFSVERTRVCTGEGEWISPRWS